MRAQAEFIVIIGLILVAAVVILFAQSGLNLGVSPVPPAVYEEQKAVSNALSNLVREASDRALMTMETHGGYPTASFGGEFSGTGTVMFRGQKVPFWAFCQEADPPASSDLKGWFEGFVEGYIRDRVQGIGEIYRRNVSIDLSGLSAEANILDSRVVVKVALPAEVDGYRIQQPLSPYTATLLTNIRGVYNFAKDYVTQNANSDMRDPAFGRFLETYTIGSLYFSTADAYDKKAVPTTGILVVCGDAIHKTREQIDRGVQDVVEFVLDQMLWWQDIPVNNALQKTPAIQSVNGNVYPELSPELYLPDEYEFDLKQYAHVTNMRFANKGRPMSVPVCVNRYHLAYDIPYPYVVSVRDPLSGYDFNFAVYAYIEDRSGFMEPGYCDESVVVGDEEVPCYETGCSASLKVTDGEGVPLEGAAVAFGLCGLGYTDAEGVAEGPIECGDGELVIYKEGYEGLIQDRLLPDVNGTYLLRGMPEITVHFREVGCTEVWSTGEADCFLYYPPSCEGDGCDTPVHLYTKCEVGDADKILFVMFNDSRGDEYPVTNINSEGMDPSCGQSAECEQCQQTHDVDACMECSETCLAGAGLVDSVLVNYLPADSYAADGESMMQGGYEPYGGFRDSYQLNGSLADAYIYMPEKESAAGYYLEDWQKDSMTQALKSQCGITPVAGAAYPERRVTEIDCDSCYSLMAAANALADYGCMSGYNQSGDFWDCNCVQEGEVEVCELCCDRTGLTGLFSTFTEECGTEVLCG